jgi:hypothetical protein
MSDKQILLTPKQAKSLLARRKQIHTFRSGSSILMGADWDRESIIEAIDKAAQIEVGGPQCRRMGHGLVVCTTDSNPLFVEVDEDKISKLESKLLAELDK